MFRTQSENRHNSENRKNLTSFSQGFNLATSTMRTILEENEGTSPCDEVAAPLKSTIIMKRHTCTV